MALSITAIPLDLLARKVGPALAEAGERLLRHGAVRIDRLDAASVKVTISGDDYRKTTVTITADPAVRNLPFHFACRCFQTYGKDTLWCAHKYAAALAVVRFAEGGTSGNWQGQLDWMLAACTPLPPPAPPPVGEPPSAGTPDFVLAFSLQRQADGEWQLRPLVVPLSHLPAVTADDPDALAGAIAQAGPRLAPHPLPAHLRPETCAPVASSARAAMAALFTHPAVAGRRCVPASALYDLLPLLADALVYGGTLASPFKRRLRVTAVPGALGLELAEGPDGIALTPELRLPDDRTLPLLGASLFVLPDGPACCLVEDRLFPVPVPAAVLQQLAAQPAMEVPAGEAADFRRRYLAPLARAVRLRGDAADCRESDAAPLPRLHLGERAGRLMLRFRFAYGEWEYPRALAGADPVQLEVAAGTLELTRVTRDLAAEARALATLESMGIVPEAFGGRDDFACTISASHFLFEAVPALRAAGFDVAGEEELRSIRVVRGAPDFTLRVSSRIDWFDLHGTLQVGDLRLSLQELRQGLHGREGFITCPDGTLVVLPPEWWRSLRLLLGMVEGEGTRVRVPRRQALALALAAAEFAGVRADADFRACRERLAAFTAIAPRPLAAGFAGALRPYQQSGYEWLHFLHDYGLGGCLADDMGLGKTIQALALLHALRASGHAERADLVVMPRSLLVNWQREAARFAPSLRVLVHADTDRPRDGADFDSVDLVLTTYGVLLRDVELLRQYPFHYAVLDEAQAIKNPQAQTARAACCLRADHRLTLTGTPVENGPLELWAQLHFLNPGLLGRQDYFREEFGIPIEKRGDAQAARFLQRLVRPVLLRRTKEQAAPDLPPRTERLVYSPMEPAQRTLYEKTRDACRERLLGLLVGDGLGRAGMHVLEALLRLRQLCLHPRLVDPDYAGESAKLLQVLETLETLQAEGHKALLFSQFTGMLAIVRAELDARGIRYAYLDGKTADRQARVDAFQQDPALPFFLISLKAGGVGLNLTAADYVLHLDPWWNPAVERQATDRTHRIGQQRPVFVSKFIAEDSVEEKILQLQDRKRALAEELVATETGFFKSLTREDVAGLFS